MRWVARALEERGFAVLEDALDATALDALREAVDALDAEAGASVRSGREPRTLGPHGQITPTGLAFPRLLSARPELAPLAPSPRLRAALAAALGDDARLELVGAVVSDRARPFFGWHTHIDGKEEGERRREGVWPPMPDVRRVFALVYLDDLDDASGPLLVHPRRAGEPTTPPHHDDGAEWPSQEVLRPRAGSAVLLDQCTWHAARAMTRGGTRRFVGVYAASAHAEPAPWADGALGRLRPRSEE